MDSLIHGRGACPQLAAGDPLGAIEGGVALRDDAACAPLRASRHRGWRSSAILVRARASFNAAVPARCLRSEGGPWPRARVRRRGGPRLALVSRDPGLACEGRSARRGRTLEGARRPGERGHNATLSSEVPAACSLDRGASTRRERFARRARPLRPFPPASRARPSAGGLRGFAMRAPSDEGRRRAARLRPGAERAAAATPRISGAEGGGRKSAFLVLNTPAARPDHERRGSGFLLLEEVEALLASKAFVRGPRARHVRMRRRHGGPRSRQAPGAFSAPFARAAGGEAWPGDVPRGMLVAPRHFRAKVCR